jgi:hypothetical protein
MLKYITFEELMATGKPFYSIELEAQCSDIPDLALAVRTHVIDTGDEDVCEDEEFFYNSCEVNVPLRLHPVNVDLNVNLDRVQSWPVLDEDGTSLALEEMTILNRIVSDLEEAGVQQMQEHQYDVLRNAIHGFMAKNMLFFAEETVDYETVCVLTREDLKRVMNAVRALDVE